MDLRKLHLENDLEGKADETVYSVRFFLSESGGLNLYETLKTDSPPMIPDVGDHVSFKFVTEDETGEEVFRDKQGTVPSAEVSSEGDYTMKTTTEFEITSVNTEYEKCVTEEQGLKTEVIKTVVLENPL